MAGGTPADMKPGKTDATYRLDGNHSMDPYNEAHLIHVGELITTVDADGEYSTPYAIHSGTVETSAMFSS